MKSYPTIAFQRVLSKAYYGFLSNLLIQSVLFPVVGITVLVLERDSYMSQEKCMIIVYMVWGLVSGLYFWSLMGKLRNKNIE